MEYMVVGAVFGLCFFILPLWAYRRGLRDGIALNNGKTPEPIQTPVEFVQKRVESKAQAREANEQNDAIAKGIANILAYDGNPQPKEEVTK